MQYTARQYATVLYRLLKETKDAPAKTAIVERFLNLVRSGRDAVRIPDVLAHIEALAYGEADQVKVLIEEAGEGTTPFPKTLGGKQVVIKRRTDASLIGGMRIRIGDTRIDGTLRRRLEDLRTIIA